MTFFNNSVKRLRGSYSKKSYGNKELSGFKRDEINAIIRKEKRRANRRLFIALGIGVLIVGFLFVIAILFFEIA